MCHLPLCSMANSIPMRRVLALLQLASSCSPFLDECLELFCCLFDFIRRQLIVIKLLEHALQALQNRFDTDYPDIQGALGTLDVIFVLREQTIDFATNYFLYKPCKHLYLSFSFTLLLSSAISRQHQLALQEPSKLLQHSLLEVLRASPSS